MPEDDFYFESLSDAARKIRSREISCAELVGGELKRINRLDPVLRTFITAAEEQSLENAKEADAALARGDKVGPLHGIPIALKDVIATKGIPMTANSRVLKDWIPEEDATCVERLKTAGAIIIGKLNLNEFAWSIPSENDLCPPPRNPWNIWHMAIGSSSGSGAALAAGLCFGSLGTDAGGSVRLPSAACGLVGLKPTHGLISRHGVLGARTIMDIGPMARTVLDTAILLQAVTGYDWQDSGSLRDPCPQYVSALPKSLPALRVGIPWKLIENADVYPEIGQAFDTTVDQLQELGATIQEVNPAWLTEARAAAFIILNAEEYVAHESSLRERIGHYGLSASLYLLQGAFLSSADYLRALKVQAICRQELDDLFREIDLLVTPTSPFLTPEAAREPRAHRRGGGAIFTAPFNVTGHPALSLPCGISTIGLPIGVQFVGRRSDELTLLQVANSFEERSGWTGCHPILGHATAAWCERNSS